jgi:hypothetical protein
VSSLGIHSPSILSALSGGTFSVCVRGRRCALPVRPLTVLFLLSACDELLNYFRSKANEPFPFALRYDNAREGACVEEADDGQTRHAKPFASLPR